MSALPGLNFSSLLVRFSTTCDVIPHENVRGAKHSLQPGLFGLATEPVQILPVVQSGLILY